MQNHRFFLFESAGSKKEWRWRLLGVGGRLVAVSGEGYPTKEACMQAVRMLALQSKDPEIVFNEPHRSALS
jgi:uncharacterized protein YegP (UPF0339 family)